jgi:hypothetical protein
VAGPSSRSTYEAVVRRVSALAAVLHRTLQVVVGMLAVAAVLTFVGLGLSDDWSRASLVLGGVLGGAIAVAAVVELRFTRDLAKARDLPDISKQEWADAARVVTSRAAEGERAVVEAQGARSRLFRLVKGLWALKGDVDTLAEGGLAPAVALGKALVPIRLLWVAGAAVASPFLLAFGLLVFVLAVTLG